MLLSAGNEGAEKEGEELWKNEGRGFGGSWRGGKEAEKKKKSKSTISYLHVSLTSSGGWFSGGFVSHL